MPTTVPMTRSYKMLTASASLSHTPNSSRPASDRPTPAWAHPARQLLRRNEGCHTAVFLRDHSSHDPQCFWDGRFVEGQVGIKLHELAHTPKA